MSPISDALSTSAVALNSIYTKATVFSKDDVGPFAAILSIADTAIVTVKPLSEKNPDDRKLYAAFDALHQIARRAKSQGEAAAANPPGSPLGGKVAKDSSDMFRWIASVSRNAANAATEAATADAAAAQTATAAAAAAAQTAANAAAAAASAAATKAKADAAAANAAAADAAAATTASTAVTAAADAAAKSSGASDAASTFLGLPMWVIYAIIIAIIIAILFLI